MRETTALALIKNPLIKNPRGSVWAKFRIFSMNPLINPLGNKKLRVPWPPQKRRRLESCGEANWPKLESPSGPRLIGPSGPKFLGPYGSKWYQRSQVSGSQGGKWAQVTGPKLAQVVPNWWALEGSTWRCSKIFLNDLLLPKK